MHYQIESKFQSTMMTQAKHFEIEMAWRGTTKRTVYTMNDCREDEDSLFLDRKVEKEAFTLSRLWRELATESNEWRTTKWLLFPEEQGGIEPESIAEAITRRKLESLGNQMWACTLTKMFIWGGIEDNRNRLRSWTDDSEVRSGQTLQSPCRKAHN